MLRSLNNCVIANNHFSDFLPLNRCFSNSRNRADISSYFNSGSAASAPIPIENRELISSRKAQKFMRKNGISSFSGVNTTNPHLNSILDNNRKWVDEKNRTDPDFFANLIKPQKPKYLYFGCSDSRVPANEILGLG
jgi:hypothetical protein